MTSVQTVQYTVRTRVFITLTAVGLRLTARYALLRLTVMRFFICIRDVLCIAQMGPTLKKICCAKNSGGVLIVSRW